ncbi:MAG: PTS transporter subunit EIIC [Turicibacter sp.]|nr:PTS transporter subunit EIIC [Turicibacter sp.]
MSTERKSFMDKLMDNVDKLAGPMTHFGQIPFVRAITNGMVASVGITMVGSIFLILFLLSSDGGLTETALLPFMRPIAGDIVLVNNLSMGIMAVYMAIAMGSEYAHIKGFNKTTGAVGTFFAFILLNFNAFAQTTEGVNALPTNFWGGPGVITAILATAIAVNVIDFCLKKNIVIKLPDSVPPAISDSFTAIIPYFLIAVITWGIRTLIGINVPELIGDVLLPIFAGADNVFVYSIAQFLVSLFWMFGLHGCNIVGAVTGPLTNIWLIENVAAFDAGYALPNVWTPNLGRLSLWVSTCWPILFYMFRSSKKIPHLKPLAAICFPPAIFSIIEPMMFGLPIVLNPFLFVPFILTHTLTGALTYLATQIGFMGRMYINLPWATPAPILGFLSPGGSIGGALIVVVNFLIGLIVFYPFWKAYEKSEVARLEEEEAVKAAAEVAPA